MRADARSFQVALVADSLVNPPALDDSLLGLLEAERWGVIQLPPADLDEQTARSWLEQVAEQVAEFRRNDYSVVILLDDGPWADDLTSALVTLGVDELPRLERARDKGRAQAFLRRHVRRPAPEDRGCVR